MKLLSFRRPDGTASWGILKAEGVIDIGSRAPGLKHALWAMTSLAEEASRHADFKFAEITSCRRSPIRRRSFALG